MLQITTTDKKITLIFNAKVLTYPLNKLGYKKVSYGIVFFDGMNIISNVPVSEITVNGTQATSENIDDLLDSLFKSGSDGGGSLPIEITDVNGLQAELDTIVTNKILYENEYNALSQAEKDDPSISYFIIEPPLRAFLEQVALDGGIIEDATALVASYLALTPQQKASDLVLLPGAYKEGYVYGIKSDGKYEKLPFTRGSAGTRFDSNLNMQLISPNIPRIDYGNYSASTKLLLEKESKNLLRDSNFSLGLNNTGNGYTIEDYNYGMLEKRVSLVPNSYYYKRYTSDESGVPLQLSVILQTDFPSFTTNTNTSVATHILGGSVYYPYKTSNIRDDIYITNTLRGSGQASGTSGNMGIVKYLAQNVGYLNMLALQLEKNKPTSYIPTTDRAETRSADSLSINLSANSTIYIKTVKEEKTITKSAGVWNVQDDILESDGIQLITIKYN